MDFEDYLYEIVSYVTDNNEEVSDYFIEENMHEIECGYADLTPAEILVDSLMVDA